MRPQELDMKSEAMADFREKIDLGISALIRNMIKKDLGEGSLTAKIKVTIERSATEDGEIVQNMKLEPDVNINIKAKGNIPCSDVTDLIVAVDEDGKAMVASNQLDMNELLGA